MKSMSFLFLFILLSFPLLSIAQDYDESREPAVVEEEVMDSEELSEVIDGAAAIPEQERQEDVIHPEGEHEWSLGGEDLPAEEYE
jgi:hypothetical protein